MRRIHVFFPGVNVLLLTFFVLAGLAWASEPAKTTTAVNLFIDDGLAFALGESRAEIMQNLGAPDHAEISLVPNPHHPGRRDRLHTWHYENGLSIKIYEVLATKKEFVIWLSIASDRYKTKAGLDVGAERERVHAVLGDPRRHTSANATYYDTVYRTSRVNFSFRDNRIDKITWIYHFD